MRLIDADAVHEALDYNAALADDLREMFERGCELLRDVVGLYVDPARPRYRPDEKSQIQALDRTQPGLPMKKGRLGTMTHDYKRNETTTLFAALNVLDGTVIGRNMQRHRHQEFIRFLNA